MQQLRDALNSELRLRKTRIIGEAGDHLHSSADELEQQGMPRRATEAEAVAQLGDPRRFAREFSPPARLDWLVDATPGRRRGSRGLCSDSAPSWS
jgi:hypothetical protein